MLNSRHTSAKSCWERSGLSFAAGKVAVNEQLLTDGKHELSYDYNRRLFGHSKPVVPLCIKVDGKLAVNRQLMGRKTGRWHRLITGG